MRRLEAWEQSVVEASKESFGEAGGNIALASGLHELAYATHHQWAEPMEEGFARALKHELERSGPPSDAAVIEVVVERFHGALGGEVILDATWRVRPLSGDSPVDVARFSGSVVQANSGYEGLAVAHYALIQQLARVIADAPR